VSTNKMIERVPRIKLADSVALQLEKLITEGEYKVGDKLPPERVLAEDFGVGRSSMREALRMVESGGLLRTDHGVGVFVVKNQKHELAPADLVLDGNYTVSNLFEARLALEREAAGLAARRIDAEQIEQLQEILDEAVRPGITDDEFIQLDSRLHQAISAASGNPLLLNLSKSIDGLFVVYSHRVIRLPGRRAVAHAGHVQIVEAVSSGDVRAAQLAVANHLLEVEKDIIENLKTD
jgi:GntR family transcriptional repressor for pyruvate dehydrogenase complex